MTRSELIERLSLRYATLPGQQVDKAVRMLLIALSNALKQKRRIEIRDFGVFTMRHRAPGKARNPRSGESVKTGERYKPHFKPGKELKERVNSSAAQSS